MTKHDLIKQVAEAKNLPKACSEALVNQVFDSMKNALQRGERVEIRALGSFEIRHYGSFIGRNPRTGTSVAVKPKRLPFFRAGSEMCVLLNAQLSRTQEFAAFGDDLRHQPPKTA
jgi:integration host factor subunit beta